MTASPAAPPPQLSHRQILVVFSGLVLAMLLAALDSMIVSTALPRIVSELGGLERVAWVVTAYLLAQTIVTPIYGKLGDLYGRKIVLQSAIVIFLIGSVLCGLSRSMMQLVVFRAIQGLGGGGLNVTTQAVVGDIVPARERGRYQGIFGAVFGLASIAGPLLGGYFTTHLTWRWIFYVNLPFGALALAVIAATLPANPRRVRHAIDYAGAALLATVLSSIILVTDLGGTTVPWSSPIVFGLAALAAVTLAVFIVVERRSPEPVLPLRLFAKRAFTVTSLVGFVVGFALFGSVTYFPLYLQEVKGVSPTSSGLMMVPMMGGMLTMSIISGQLISRTGRYKIFPVIGTAVMTLGLWLLSRLDAASSTVQASLFLLVLGTGLGMVMQVLVIAVQNAVEYRDLGVATSGATLFRLIGGSLGTAVLGAVFAGHLAATRGRIPYAQAFTEGLHTVFLVAFAVSALGALLIWLMPEHPLRATVAATARDAGSEAGEAFARPSDDISAKAQLAAAFQSIADRDVQRGHIAMIVARAGESLTPLGAWLLVQMERHPERDPVEIAHARGVSHERATEAIDELTSRGLVASPSRDSRRLLLTAAGCDTLERLVIARREHLDELSSEWDPAHQPDAAEFLREVVRASVPDVRRPA
jgi:EmrB/QacA subfamily drug resistance transporter